MVDEEASSNDRTCRICLEEDCPNDMIAPCSCKGSSKWVHRDCLDDWRTTNQDLVAFSKCTECLQDYHMEVQGGALHRSKRIKYCLHVTHDIGFATLMVNILIALFGVVVWGLDRHQGTLTPECETNWCKCGTYYACGLLFLLVGLGMYGVFLFCTNDCSISNAMNIMLEEPIQEPAPAPPVVSTSPLLAGKTYSPVDTSDFCSGAPTNETLDRSTAVVDPAHRSTYQSRYHGRRQHRGNHCCPSGGYYYYGDGCYCPGCTNTDCTCCFHTPTNCGDSSSNDALPIMVVILAVIAIVLATIGFFVGMFIAVVVIQRILVKHMWMLKRRRLVQEFRVVDLSQGTSERNDIEFLPAPPLLPVEDVTYLKKMGLMES